LILAGKIVDDIGAFSTANENVKSDSGFDDIYNTTNNPYKFKFAAKVAETQLHSDRLQIIRNHQVLTFSTIGKDLIADKEQYVLGSSWGSSILYLNLSIFILIFLHFHFLLHFSQILCRASEINFKID